MNQEIICRIGEFLVSHSDFKYDPCDRTAVLIHVLVIIVGTISIPLIVRKFRQRSQEAQLNDINSSTSSPPNIRPISDTNNIIRGLLFIVFCGLILGYVGIAPSSFGVAELIGIAAVVGCVSLPLQFENTWFNRLRSFLFFGGFLTIIISTSAASSTGFNSFAAWIMVISFWSVLGMGKMNLSAFNTLQSGLLLSISALLSLGIGYLASFYFTF
jgi:hypothetical protein